MVSLSDAEFFVSQLPVAWRTGVDPQTLVSRLQRVLDLAREHWPTVRFDARAYWAHLASAVRAEVSSELDSLYTADLYIAAACVAQCREGFAAFETAYLSTPLVLPRGSDTDELRAVLRERLFVGPDARIGTYGGRGPLQNWLKVAAVRAWSNLNRGHAQRDTEPLEDLPLTADGPELGYLKQLYRSEFNQALAAALPTLSVRSRNLLRLRYVNGLTVAQVASLNQVHVATVARWQAKALAQVLAHVRQALMVRLQVQPSELESILRLAKSGLEVSLTRALEAPPRP